ncbi:DUF2637 domain-containing protein [Thermobifida cellulosilytica]|uniref:DUF2637 domain-containing protein n=1 Tax=Thermobifida cellulosilytica TB100 TaxID=665004 RepID=A0A147KM77_THECS|nr:DUF2637 domain-containing protein [Thermobifida cellulosilytica]KUP98338.1 hypothetical protein AC529_02290 [Thermobifida cellulosilytica TB100]
MAVLGVAVIASCAVLLSYNGIYQIAVRGGAAGWTAHLYPGLFTLLLLMAFWTTYLLREAPRRRRLWVDLLVLAMILAAAAASALRSFRYELLEWVATLVVAIAPWVALLISFRLTLWIVAQVRGERPAEPQQPAGEADEPGPDAPEPDEDGEDTEAVRVPAAAAPVDPLPRRASVAPEPVPARSPLPDPVADTTPFPAPEPAVDPAAAAAEPAVPDLFDSFFRAEPAGRSRVPEETEETEAAPASEAASSTAEGGALPKRVPSREGSAIRQAAGVRDRSRSDGDGRPVETAPAESERTGVDDEDWESVDDPEEGWVGDPVLADDPAGDEAHPAVPEPAAPQAASGSASDGAGADDGDDEEDTVPPGPEPVIRRRPMVLRPRRSGPLRLPSSQLRSTPTPPEE